MMISMWQLVRNASFADRSYKQSQPAFLTRTHPNRQVLGTRTSPSLGTNIGHDAARAQLGTAPVICADH